MAWKSVNEEDPSSSEINEGWYFDIIILINSVIPITMVVRLQ